MSARPGEQFGRYTLLKKLATGGMAEIWLARQRGVSKFTRPVVIKKMLTHLAGAPEFVRMFLDEARTSAKLSHPNVVQVYDLGREGEHYYMAMEYIAGETLSAINWRCHKQGRTLPLALAARVALDCCKGLSHAHALTDVSGRSLDIVHRDISPQNILVSYEGETKIVDFGIAKAADRDAETGTNMLKGKISYMSPEQCLVGSEHLDARSDIFSLGIVLYETCTGKRLFKHESELMVMKMITEHDVMPPRLVNREISPHLNDIITKALARDPERRFRSAEHMKAELTEYLRDCTQPASERELAQVMRRHFSEERAAKDKLLAGTRAAQRRPNRSGIEIRAVPSDGSTGQMRRPVRATPTPARASGSNGLVAPEHAMGSPITIAKATSTPGIYFHPQAGFISFEQPPAPSAWSRGLMWFSLIAITAAMMVLGIVGVRELRTPEKVAFPAQLDAHERANPSTPLKMKIPKAPPSTAVAPPVEDVQPETKPRPESKRRRANKARLAKKQKTSGCEARKDFPLRLVTIDTKPASEVFHEGRSIGQTPINKARLPAGCVKLRFDGPKGSVYRNLDVGVSAESVFFVPL